MESLRRVHELLPAGAVRAAFDVVLIIIGAWLVYVILNRAIRAVSRRLEARIEAEASRQVASTALRVIAGLINAGVIFCAGVLVLDQLGIAWVTAGPVLGRIIGTIVVAWVVFHVVAAAIAAAVARAKESIERDARRQRVTTLLLLVRNFTKYVVIFAAGVMVLDQVGVDIGVVLAGAGIAGLAVGFGAQNLVRDVVSGFFIIMEGQYAVGDLVEINGVLGRVEEVGLRATKLRDPNGQLRYFSNGAITRANNYTEDYVAYVVNIPLQSEAPADPGAFAQAVFKDFEREFRVFAETPSVKSVETLPTYSRLLRVRVNAIPGRHTIVVQKLPARVTAALDRAGHALPAGTEVTCSLLFPAPGGRG